MCPSGNIFNAETQCTTRFPRILKRRSAHVSVRGLSIRSINMRILHIRRTQICISCAVHSRLCDYERRTFNEIECRIFFQTIYVMKSQFGGFAFILFYTLMFYTEFIQVTKALLIDCMGRNSCLFWLHPPPPVLPALASAALYLLHREKKESSFLHVDPLVSVKCCYFFIAVRRCNKKSTKKHLYADKFYWPNLLGWRHDVLRTLKTFHASLVMVFI